MSDERPDLRHHTTTLYYQQRDPYQQRSGSTSRLPVRGVPAGPGVKNLGSQVGYAYDERPGGKLTMGKTEDLSSIWTKTSKEQDQAHRRSSYSPHPEDGAQVEDGLRGTTKKVVYFDGKSHHIVNAPENDLGFKWTPPHLTYFDLVHGQQLGIRETPGAIKIKMVGSKHRYLPTMEPQGTSMWSVTHKENTMYGGPMYATLAPTAGSTTDWHDKHGSSLRPSTARTASEYGRSKFIGYQEYEASTKMLNGVGSWERTQRHMMSSMATGRPSRLMGLAEHSATLSASRRAQTPTF